MRVMANSSLGWPLSSVSRVAFRHVVLRVLHTAPARPAPSLWTVTAKASPGTSAHRDDTGGGLLDPNFHAAGRLAG
jgi:hypothetical protein